MPDPLAAKLSVTFAIFLETLFTDIPKIPIKGQFHLAMCLLSCKEDYANPHCISCSLVHDRDLSLRSGEPARSHPANRQSTSSGVDTGAAATVYFYRYKQFVGSALAPSVYSDEGELGRMENGRFFRAKFTPGKHIFRSNDKQSGIESELKAGEEYYIRVELVPGAMKGHGRLVLVPTEQGAYEIKKLKPLDADKVKDREHVLAVASSR